jgi:dTMP kinase
VGQGKFISFEGGEGSGKSTQIKRLIRELLVTGAPDRWEPLTEALLLASSRHEHVARTIRPALDAGVIVLCDRFYDSSMAYQGYAHGLGRDLIERITDIAVGSTRPNLTLIFDMPVKIGLERAGARGTEEDRYEQMGLAFHQSLKEAYLDIAAREPDRCVIIQADQSIESVEAEILAVLKTRLSI